MGGGRWGMARDAYRADARSARWAKGRLPVVFRERELMRILVIAAATTATAVISRFSV